MTWRVTNRLGQTRTFDDELEARCWAARIGFSARVEVVS